MSDQPMTEAMYYILLTLLRPCHGYGIMHNVRDLSGGRVEMGPGTLYGILTRLKKEKFIQLQSTDERRKTYVITAAGKAALDCEYERLKFMVRDGRALEENNE